MISECGPSYLDGLSGALSCDPADDAIAGRNLCDRRRRLPCFLRSLSWRRQDLIGFVIRSMSLSVQALLTWRSAASEPPIEAS